MFHRLRLLGDGKTSKVDARQKESKIGGMSIIVRHERNLLTNKNQLHVSYKLQYLNLLKIADIK